MYLRPFFAKLLAPSALFIFFAMGGTSYVGCSSGDARLSCDDSGQNCFWCDANGCKPADPTVNSAGSGSSGGDTSSSSSSSSGSGPCDPKVTTCGCKIPADCPVDMMCIDGLCIIPCDNTFECGSGRICVNGKCEIGCNDQKPCVTGEKCVNGYCVPDPTKPQCQLELPCPGGQICVETLCETSCTKNTDCPSGQVCDSTTGGCIPNPSPIPSCGPDKPCSGTAQCGPGGYCQFPCTTLNDCKLIDSRYTACDTNVCKTDEELNPQCTLQKPCPAGQNCVSNKCL